jgi:uncharacterized protein HemY
LSAEALVLTGDAPRALLEMDRALEVVRDRTECLMQMVIIANEAHDEARVDAALDSLARAGCEDEQCERVLVFAAQQQEGRGRSSRALALYERAYARHPESDELLREIARLAVKSGEHAKALEALEELAHRHPDEKSWTQAADTQRQSILQGLIRP